jgi:hypothetical protein
MACSVITATLCLHSALNYHNDPLYLHAAAAAATAAAGCTQCADSAEQATTQEGS